MGQFTLPGGWTTSPYLTNSNYGVVPRTLTQNSVTIPSGRAMLNGSTQIMLTAWRLMLGGYASTANTVSVTLGGVGSPATTIAGAASNAFDTGDRAFNPGLTSATGAGSLVISFSNRIYFGRQSYAPSPVGGSGAASWGAMVGLITYVEACSAPTSLAASVVGANATVTWGAPADNGGSGITGYVLQVANNGSFTGATQYSEAGTSKALTLTPGTYYLRIAARNGVTDAAGTTSAWSSTVSFTIQAGFRVQQAGTFVYVIPHVQQSGTPVVVETFVQVGGIFVPAS